jgi:hypothetical protein
MGPSLIPKDLQKPMERTLARIQIPKEAINLLPRNRNV